MVSAQIQGRQVSAQIQVCSRIGAVCVDWWLVGGGVKGFLQVQNFVMGLSDLNG